MLSLLIQPNSTDFSREHMRS